MNAGVVGAEVCAVKMNMHAERFRRDKERLDKFEDSIAKLNEASALLTQMVALHSEELRGQASRVTRMEQRPSALWDKLIGGAVGAVSGGFAAALVATLLK